MIPYTRMLLAIFIYLVSVRFLFTARDFDAEVAFRSPYLFLR